MKYICPVCGYPELDEEPYDRDGNPSYNICSCCGFEFGYDDGSEKISFDEYREKWISNGFKWFSKNKRPKSWNPNEQLKNINK